MPDVTATPFEAAGSLTGSPGVEISANIMGVTGSLEASEIYVGQSVAAEIFLLACELDASEIYVGQSVAAEIFLLTGDLQGAPTVEIPSVIFSANSNFEAGEITTLAIDRSVPFYTFTLTGNPDIIIPMESFQGRFKSGDPSFLAVVIPGIDYETEVTNRSTGKMRVHVLYKDRDGNVLQQEQIAEVNLETIKIDESGKNKSISLTGHKTETHSPKAVTLEGITYKNLYEGKFRFRCAVPDPYLRPGDAVTAGEDSFTADEITYIVSVSKQSMEVAETV